MRRTSPLSQERAACAALVAAQLLLAACGVDPVLRRERLPGERPPVYPLSYRLAPGETLLSYAWDGRPPTPSVFRTGEIVLDYGEPPPLADTTLYVPFNEGEGESARDVSAQGHRVTATECAWGPGRFGHALHLARPASRLEVLAAAGELAAAPFTLELWVRTEPDAARRDAVLVDAPGLFTLSLCSGYASVVVEDEPGSRIKSQHRLNEDQWNHVAVVLEAPDYPHLRLVLNEETNGLVLPEAPSGSAARLVVGAGLRGWIDGLRLSARAAASGELFEAYRAGAEAGEHVLELELADGRRTQRLWAGALRSPELRAEEDWRRGELVHAVVRDGRLAWAPGHWERDRAASPPRCRTTHPTVYVGESRALVFGGETHDSHMGPMINTDDTWLYHVDERRWDRVEGKPAPPPRCHQPAAYSPDHGVVLLAGGMHDEDDRWVLADDTWVYHVEERRWEERNPSGVDPPPLSDCGLAYHPGLRRFVLFNNRWLLLYDPEGDRWERRPPPAIVDALGNEVDYSPGGSFMTGYDPGTGHIVLFGGERKPADEVVFHNATAHYDVDANALVVQDTPLAPSPRVRSGFAYDSRRGRFLLFGGVREQEGERMDDLWSYRAATAEWRPIAAANTPSARGGYFCTAYDPELDVSVLLCGRHSYALYVNDAWRLRVDDEAVATATWVFDREGFPRADRFLAEWREPPGSEVSFRFAGSPGGREFRPWGATPSAGLRPGDRYVKLEVRMSTSDPAQPPEVLSVRFAEEGDPRERPAGVLHCEEPLPSLRF